MEIPITRYPWQSQNPVDYIKSFRYFMNFQNPFPSNIKKVWGPAGDRGSIEWWPGNDVVDYISIAIYGLPDKNISDPKKQETFETIFKRKYWRMRFINKPIFITEFGVKGPEDFQTKWLEDAAKVIRMHKQIIGVNYFNMSDTPKAWGDIKPPDWSISKESFYRFIKVLEKE
jgi:beta-mannanase